MLLQPRHATVHCSRALQSRQTQGRLPPATIWMHRSVQHRACLPQIDCIWGPSTPCMLLLGTASYSITLRTIPFSLDCHSCQHAQPAQLMNSVTTLAIPTAFSLAPCPAAAGTYRSIHDSREISTPCLAGTSCPPAKCKLVSTNQPTQNAA